MSRRQAKYSRESLLSLKPYTDALPMIFRARYLHKDGRWCTFTQVEVLSPEHIGFLDCGHINITRSVVEFHQVLSKSDHHRMVFFVARVGTYSFDGDQRGNLMLERMLDVPSLWFENAHTFALAVKYIQNIEENLK